MSENNEKKPVYPQTSDIYRISSDLSEAVLEAIALRHQEGQQRFVENHSRKRVGFSNVPNFDRPSTIPKFSLSQSFTLNDLVEQEKKFQGNSDDPELKISRSRTYEIIKEYTDLESKLSTEKQEEEDEGEEPDDDNNNPVDPSKSSQNQKEYSKVDLEPPKDENNNNMEASHDESWKLWAKKIIMNAMFAFIIFLIVLPSALSFGGILTQHEKLRNFFPVAIKICIFSNIIHHVVAVSSSTLLYNVSMVQSSNILFLTLMANVIADSCEDQYIIPTVLFVCCSSTVLIGICYYLIGRFKLVSAIQYMPFPVMAGFLVAVGIYLLRGGVTMMTARTLESWDDYSVFFIEKHFLLAIPGVAIATIIFTIERYKKHFLVMPVTLIVPVIIFWIVVKIVGTSMSELQQSNFLFKEMEIVPFYSVWTSWDFSLIDFSAVPKVLPNLIAMILLNILNTTISISALELELNVQIDTPKELMVNGISNFCCGLVGGLSGSVTFSLSQLGGHNNTNRMMGIFLTLYSIGILVIRAPVISVIPRFFFGAVLFYLGLTLVFSWLYRPSQSIPLFEYTLLIVTAVTLMVFGNNIGLPVSIAISAIFFCIPILSYQTNSQNLSWN